MKHSENSMSCVSCDLVMEYLFVMKQYSCSPPKHALKNFTLVRLGHYFVNDTSGIFLWLDQKFMSIIYRHSTHLRQGLGGRAVRAAAAAAVAAAGTVGRETTSVGKTHRHTDIRSSSPMYFLARRRK